MVIFSRGFLTGGSAFFSVRASANDTLPTLPQYIRKIIISLEAVSRSRVMPVVIPTVPIAETTSKITSESSSEGWKALIRMMPARARLIFVKATEEALPIASFSSLLPKMPFDSLLRIPLTVEIKITAKVVVFIPPAVEPGEPPMNIRNVVRILPAGESEAVSTLLKPAVLAVTESKREARSA